MLQSRDRAAESSEAPRAENVLVSGARVDAAHVLGDAPAAASQAAPETQADLSDASWAAFDPAEVAQAVASQAVASQAELEAALLQIQAEQLAQHLALRQADLDRREAQLNARCADFDQELRSARLWLEEKRQELAQQEDEFRARQRQAAAEAAQRPATPEGGGERQRAAEELAEREKRLFEAETSLAAQLAETAAVDRELQQRREQLEAQARLDRRRLVEIQRKNEAELAQKKLGVERESEQLDHRRAAIERSRQDLLLLQREALEMRLAAEELKAELSGALAPAAVERSIAALRKRLAESYRLESAAAAADRTELESLKAELAAEAETWSRRQEDLQRWATAKQAEFDDQAIRLEARQHKLDHQEKSLQEQLQAWREERFTQQQELRRLQAELRQRAP